MAINGYGYGYGDGSGDGDRYGYGDGYGKQTISLDASAPMLAVHYIVKTENGYKMRNGKTTTIGEVVHEPTIEMCIQGLHASITKEDADRYKPCTEAVLTEVLVWGDMIFESDKLVAQYRKIVREL